MVSAIRDKERMRLLFVTTIWRQDVQQVYKTRYNCPHRGLPSTRTRVAPHNNLPNDTPNNNNNNNNQPSPLPPTSLTPQNLIKTWQNHRRITPQEIHFQNYISLLIISEEPALTLFTKHQLDASASHRGLSRRLLLHTLTLPPVTRSRSHEQPIDLDDITTTDFALCTDNFVRDRVLRLAEMKARVDGWEFAEVERRVRLLADFGGEGRRTRVVGQFGVDVPKFGEGRFEVTRNAVVCCCENFMEVLVANGLGVLGEGG